MLGRKSCPQGPSQSFLHSTRSIPSREICIVTLKLPPTLRGIIEYGGYVALTTLVLDFTDMSRHQPAIASMSLGRVSASHTLEYKIGCAARSGFEGLKLFREDLELLVEELPPGS